MIGRFSYIPWDRRDHSFFFVAQSSRLLLLAILTSCILVGDPCRVGCKPPSLHGLFVDLLLQFHRRCRKYLSTFSSTSSQCATQNHSTRYTSRFGRFLRLASVFPIEVPPYIFLYSGCYPRPLQPHPHFASPPRRERSFSLSMFHPRFSLLSLSLFFFFSLFSFVCPHFMRCAPSTISTSLHVKVLGSSQGCFPQRFSSPFPGISFFF